MENKIMQLLNIIKDLNDAVRLLSEERLKHDLQISELQNKVKELEDRLNYLEMFNKLECD